MREKEEVTKPSFATLRANHDSSDRTQAARFVDGETVYKGIGYDMADLLKQSPAYENTCAVRMSLALMRSGVAINGRIKIKSGPLKGRSVEPGAKLLADQLSREGMLGRPQIMQPNEALKKLEKKQGVIFFWKMNGYPGGHIDLIQVHNATAVCSSACYLASKEIWFWPLD
jgi:hypothetical protein